MKIYPLFILIISIFNISCSNQTETPTKNQESVISQIQDKLIQIEPISDKNTPEPFYIINVSAFEKKEEAISEVIKLRKDNKSCNYLWIPDYESLSGKQLWAVFLGPFPYERTCLEELSKYQKQNKEAYGVLVQHKKTRLTLHSNFDRRIDNKQMNAVIIHSSPEDEEAYAAQGGEDWGWFVGEVTDYFTKNYSDKIYFDASYSDLVTESQRKLLIKKSGAEGFGYILKKGDTYKFLPHDMSGSIISGICEFFEIPEINND